MDHRLRKRESVLAMLRQLFDDVWASEQASFSDSEVSKLGKMKLSTIDLISGVPADGDVQFLKPSPPEPLEDTIARSLAEQREDAEVYGGDFDEDTMYPILTSRDCSYEQHERQPKITSDAVLSDLVSALESVSRHEFAKQSSYYNRDMFGPYMKLGQWSHATAPWEVIRLIWPCDGDTPHTGCILSQEPAVTPSNILRSEILSLVGIMIQRASSTRLALHQHWPVFVVSISSLNVRIVQAHVRYPNVVIRKSDIINVGTKWTEKIKLVLRWISNVPMETDEYRGLLSQRLTWKKHRLHVRKEAVDTLREFGTAAIRTKQATLSDSDLRDLKVKVARLQLGTGDVEDGGPRFLTPCSSEEFSPFFDKVMSKPELRVTTRYFQHAAPGPGSRCFAGASDLWYTLRESWISVLNVGFVRMIKFDEQELKPPYGRYPEYHGVSGHWHFPKMWLPVDKHRTLTGATLIQESPMGSDLLRSEILGILELMHPRILDEGFAYDSFWPVFLISISSYNVRVIQAHFEGASLVIRKSETVNFHAEPLTKLPTVLRWLCCEPVAEGLMDSEKEDGGALKFYNVPKARTGDEDDKENVEPVAKSLSKTFKSPTKVTRSPLKPRQENLA